MNDSLSSQRFLSARDLEKMAFVDEKSLDNVLETLACLRENGGVLNEKFLFPGVSVDMYILSFVE